LRQDWDTLGAGECQDGDGRSDHQAKGLLRLTNHKEYDIQFLISLHVNPAVLDALTDEEKAAIGEGHGRFIHALKQSRELITTQALVDPSQAAVVTVPTASRWSRRPLGEDRRVRRPSDGCSVRRLRRSWRTAAW
jgi:hypothetical protein